MTEKISCGKCGFLLYFGEIIKRRLYMRMRSGEEDVLRLYGNTCPKCKNKLTLKTVRVEVK
jgi:ribosomal protein L34E